MVDQIKRQDRQQEQSARQTRIRDAMQDFFRHGLPALHAKSARRDEQQGSLFETGFEVKR